MSHILNDASTRPRTMPAPVRYVLDLLYAEQVIKTMLAAFIHSVQKSI